MKVIDILFYLMLLLVFGSNIYDYFRPNILIGLQFINAVAIAMLSVIIYSLDYKLVHVPIKEKYIKPSRRRRRVQR